MSTKVKQVRYKDLFQINLKYLDYLLEKSYLSHRLLKNIKLSGDQIEYEFRKILSALLPSRYKITHGYIASSNSIKDEPIISSQIDIIIVDTLVPHRIYVIEDQGMEVVPLESVVGIFEVKRTISPAVFEDVLVKLHKIQKNLEIDKKNNTLYFPANIQGLGSIYSNPLIGILSLDHKKFKTENEYKDNYLKMIEKLQSKNKMPDLDIWASLGSSLIMATCKENDPKTLWSYVLREEGKKYPYLLKFKLKNNLNQAYYLSISLGFILYYLSNITGKPTQLDNYYFNHSINAKK